MACQPPGQPVDMIGYSIGQLRQQRRDQAGTEPAAAAVAPAAEGPGAFDHVGPGVPVLGDSVAVPGLGSSSGDANMNAAAASQHGPCSVGDYFVGFECQVPWDEAPPGTTWAPGLFQGEYQLVRIEPGQTQWPWAPQPQGSVTPL